MGGSSEESSATLTAYMQQTQPQTKSFAGHAAPNVFKRYYFSRFSFLFWRDAAIGQKLRVPNRSALHALGWAFGSCTERRSLLYWCLGS